MTNILVTGGAGYIGSHACKVLKARGYTPVTYDNLARAGGRGEIRPPRSRATCATATGWTRCSRPISRRR